MEALEGLLGDVEFWHWWAFAVAMIAIEVVAPSTFLLWPAISAAVIGFVLLLEPDIALGHQILSFAVLAVITSVAWQVWLQRHPMVSDRPNLNLRSQQYVGRRFTVVSDFVNGRGRVKVGDSQWSAEADADVEILTGQSVEVEAAEGTVLRVRPVDAPSASSDSAES